MSKELVSIDGSLLEGGGQILRMSLTLSVLCDIPVCVYNIRAGRSKPGLMAQHLKGVQLVRDISKAKVEGDYIGSTEIKFWPGKISGGYYNVDVQTAGSVTLLLQVALPCVLFAKDATHLTLGGGTNTEMAPQVDYMTEIFRPNLQKFGATFDFQLIKRGYYPKGGGLVKIDILPVKSLNAITLIDAGNVDTIYGWSFVAGTLPIDIAHTSADAAVKVLKKNFPQANIDIERYKERHEVANNNCSGLILLTETTTGCVLGSASLGKRDVSPDITGVTTAEDLLTTIKQGWCVDQYCQDQLIIFMALAKGKSRIKVGRVTQHTETAIFVAEKLTKAKFEVTKDESNHIISCDGLGLENESFNY